MKECHLKKQDYSLKIFVLFVNKVMVQIPDCTGLATLDVDLAERYIDYQVKLIEGIWI
jgi:hypothetical protein